MTSLIECALAYAELGYFVFPCVPGKAIPLTEHGFKDASNNPEQIRLWWDKNPDANIGLATAGLLVIDIDGEKNPWPVDQDQILSLSGSPICLTPGGGSHHFFRQPDGINLRCTQSVLADRVDTRADGGYVVTAPSIKDGKSYRWLDGMELDVPPSELPVAPAWLIELLTKKEDKQQSGDALPLEIKPGNRNGILFSRGCALRRIGLTESEIYASLMAVNRERCRPPIDDSEIRQIARSAAKHEPDQISVAVAEDHYQQTVEPETQEAGPVDPGATPDRLLKVPGLISDVVDYTLKTAPYPEPTLAFCGALALLSYLTGQIYRDEFDNRTNLYLLSLANSGTGKEHPRKINAKILDAVGQSGSVGGSFASGEGIEDGLHANKKMLFQVDEFDGLLLKITGGKDPRFEAIVSTLLSIYSASNSVYTMRTKAAAKGVMPDRSISNPHLVIMGTAVPKFFYASLSERLAQNGLFSRLLIFQAGSRGRGHTPELCDLPEIVTDMARMILEPSGDSWGGGNLTKYQQRTITVKAVDEARECLLNTREKMDDAYSQAEAEGDTAAMAMWARAFEKACKLSLIYSLSDDPINPRIRIEATEWAVEMATHQTLQMLYMLNKHFVRSNYDARLKALVALLERWKASHGDQWCPFWRISRTLPWSVRDHDEVRAILQEQRLIEFKTGGNIGRPGKLYRLRKQ